MKTAFLAIYIIALTLKVSAAEQYPLTEFFPAGAFSRGGIEFGAGWYANHLRAFKEPSIQPSPQMHAETYRFTMLPTFNFPLTVRLTVAPDGSGTAVAKRLTGKGGYEPGKLDFERTYAITQKKVQTLRSTLAARKFWQMPTSLERTVCDGSEYIFEASRDNRYHVITRTSPEDGDRYRALCIQLLRLGHLDEIDAYLRERPKSK